jgi:ABC-type antimicrobial peptide transport system permease subunit
VRSREIAALLRFPFVAASGVSSGVGALALVMTCIDLKGVAAFAVVQRPREIGVRMALGATPLSVLRSIVAGSVPRVALGIALGIRVCFALSKIAAAYVPARRAIRIDPIAALRQD